MKNILFVLLLLASIVANLYLFKKINSPVNVIESTDTKIDSLNAILITHQLKIDSLKKEIINESVKTNKYKESIVTLDNRVKKLINEKNNIDTIFYSENQYDSIISEFFNRYNISIKDKR